MDKSSVESIYIPHHSCRPVEDAEMITKQLLGPTPDLMNVAHIFQDFLDSTAVTEPKEFYSPKEFLVLTDGPTATACFSNKRVEVTFSFSTTT